VFVRLWRSVAEEYLREMLYMAELAKLNMSINLNLDGITIQWSGFNHKLQEFIVETLNKLLKLSEEDLEHIFNQEKEKLLLTYKNAYLGQTC
jgi:secreted Zn-dependent insulinase-like peptidase